MSELSLYLVDTETTSTEIDGDIIEISFYRLSTGDQRTWYLKAVNEKKINPEALRVNGHKLEDITWKTKEGEKKYQLPEEVLPEIENWMADDEASALDRVLTGHNIAFDEKHMRELWKRCNSSDTFPFGTHSLDTKSVAIFFDWAAGHNNKVYSLGRLVKRFGLVKRKAHAAEQDVLMNVDLLNYYKKNFSAKLDNAQNEDETE